MIELEPITLAKPLCRSGPSSREHGVWPTRRAPPEMLASARPAQIAN
jgi:hypothetical protein